MDFYTYCYFDEKGKPYYIGKGRGNRIQERHSCEVPPADRRIKLKQNLTEEEAFKHEVYMIHVLGRKDLKTGCLVNLTFGGEGASGWVMKEETKQKISEAAMGRPRADMEGDLNPMRNPEVAEKVAGSKRGKPRDEETRRKISESLQGRKNTPETKSKKSKAALGKPKSEQHRKNISVSKSGENHPSYGRTGEKSFNYGRKFYVNFEGKVIFTKENPGEGWQRGRVWKFNEELNNSCVVD